MGTGPRSRACTDEASMPIPSRPRKRAHVLGDTTAIIPSDALQLLPRVQALSPCDPQRPAPGKRLGVGSGVPDMSGPMPPIMVRAAECVVI